MICQQFAQPIARRAAALVDGDAFEELSRTLDPEAPFFKETRQKFYDIKKETGCLYLFAMAWKTPEVHVFVIDGGRPGEPGYSEIGSEDNISYYPKAYFDTWANVPSPAAADYSLFNYSKTWGWLASGFAPILNSRGDVVGVVGCDYDVAALDITMFRRIFWELLTIAVFGVIGLLAGRFLIQEAARQQSRLVASTEAAEEASRVKTEFLATISHEIRTPLNAIIGFSEIELRRELPPVTRVSLGNIHHSANTLWLIINDILDISKIESGRLQLNPYDYDSALMISDTAQLNLGRLGSKPITFELRIEDDFPRRLFGDELRVKQILNNLLSNAFKYTRAGRVALRAEWASLGEEGALVAFTVSDTGPGIRAEDMGRLFSKYTQLDQRANRLIEGTGLGLAITRNLVEMMGGTIEVNSEYGRGAE
ncbi:MAG: hybrid sensor histidine kinase/response regulator, partial [Candidatus Adiutrix sp.]|nr:hybrid sensor histidine kinase/response regulator [Candidatus Adiutrix sp.]